MIELRVRTVKNVPLQNVKENAASQLPDTQNNMARKATRNTDIAGMAARNSWHSHKNTSSKNAKAHVLICFFASRPAA
jgi:hypothetical protein